MTLSDNAYDVIKKIVTIIIPAFITIYVGVDGILVESGLSGLPYTEAVSGIAALIATVLGSMIGISSSGYSGDGSLLVDSETFYDGESDDASIILNLDIPFEELVEKNSIVLKVVLSDENENDSEIDEEELEDDSEADEDEDLGD